MEAKNYAGRSVFVDEDGCLLNFWEWTFEIGESIAKEAGIRLTPDHWQIVNLAREGYAQTGRFPCLDEIMTICHLHRRDLDCLFPQNPDQTIARIAGIPTPNPR